jgi:hypothetical protein
MPGVPHEVGVPVDDMALALPQFALDNPIGCSPVAQIFAEVNAELTDVPDPALHT